MKKLLLLLFISFAFISSVNASSIKGAFGYSLGDVEVIEGWHSTFNRITNISKQFKPYRPLPGFKRYYIHVTLDENKIYSIRASTYEDEKLYERSCYDSKIIDSALKLLQSKYGRFKLIYNQRVEVEYTAAVLFGGVREYKGIEESRRWEFNDGNRSINLSCYKSLKLGQAFSLELEYIDNDLYKLFKEENRIKNGESQPINLNTTPEI